MPFCPKCKAEYVVGITKCSDCEIPLVNALPIEPYQDEHNVNLDNQPNEAEVESSMVYLCTINNEIEAIILRDLLKEAGIASSCQNNSIVRYFNPGLAGPEDTNFGRNDIMVLDNDYKAAKRIAQDYFKSIENREKEEKSEEEE